jgi:hypothetical protein
LRLPRATRSDGPAMHCRALRSPPNLHIITDRADHGRRWPCIDTPTVTANRVHV